jgi:PAS domain S-box-containing protein/putative nucleotidyltransferase with HDIG domain
MDMNFNYTYVSPSAYRLLGYTVNELTKMKMADVVTPKTFNLLMDVFVEEMEIEKRDDKDLTRSRVLEYQHRHKNGSKIWMETTLNFLRDQNNTVVGVLGIVRDISKRKLSEMALADSFEKLRKTLDGTVQAISLAVETRDPYTAGHQRRVAELAVAIADQMGVEDDIIQGIRIAGSIHDIGKVAIPAEFLTKPGGIMSDIEYTVIKAHSYIGYEILKSIDFPWPIAQIVYQHHERLDGSGYPRGLTGDKILFEAKILAIADVVESMASHRPYRVAKGINKALLEIKGKRGVLYDGDVVDACLVVLNEKGFEFVSKSLLSG